MDTVMDCLRDAMNLRNRVLRNFIELLRKVLYRLHRRLLYLLSYLIQFTKNC